MSGVKSLHPIQKTCISCSDTWNLPVHTSNDHIQYFDNPIKFGVHVHLITHPGLILMHLFILSESTILHVSASKHRSASECHNSTSSQSNWTLGEMSWRGITEYYRLYRVTVQEVQSLNLPVQACLEKGIAQSLFPWIKTEEVCWNLPNICPDESKYVFQN